MLFEYILKYFLILLTLDFFLHYSSFSSFAESGQFYSYYQHVEYNNHTSDAQINASIIRTHYSELVNSAKLVPKCLLLKFILMLLLSYFTKVHFKALVTENSSTVALTLKSTGCHLYLWGAADVVHSAACRGQQQITLYWCEEADLHDRQETSSTFIENCINSDTGECLLVVVRVYSLKSNSTDVIHQFDDMSKKLTI